MIGINQIEFFDHTGCEFCTVTGFFGDSIRFRSNESIVNEMLRLKERARRTRGKFAVFFVDDNFAINVKRTKSLLRDIIAAGAELSWVGQISANLLRDPELLDLIATSGGKWIFIGMESLDAGNLKSVNKSFNKPAEYAGVLQELARRNVYAITSFIFGLDNDTAGVAARTLDEMRTWPPVLPVFGQITPFPATPLYLRLERGSLDPSEALAGVRALSYGAYPAEHDDPAGTGGGVPRLVGSVQPGSYRARPGIHRGRARALQNQPLCGAAVLPRYLLPAEGSLEVAAADSAELESGLPACEGRVYRMARRARSDAVPRFQRTAARFVRRLKPERAVDTRRSSPARRRSSSASCRRDV